MGFWLQLGVSGFRMDAVPFVIETKGARSRKPVEQYDMLRDAARLPAVAQRRRDHPGRGQRAAGDGHGVLRRRRRPHAHDVQLPGQPAPVLRAGRGRRAPARAGAEGDEAAARDGAVGPLPAQPRRARPRPAHRRAARRRSSTPSGPRRTCSSTSAASGAGSRRCSTATAAARARLQPDVHAARHAGAPLRRRDRHGRRPALPERNCARTPMQWSTEPHGGFTKADKPWCR